MLLICLAAQATATLQTLGQFAVPAFTPTLLNLCWLTAIWVAAPHWAPNRHAQAYVVAASILIGGCAPVGRAIARPAPARLPLRVQLVGQPGGLRDRADAHAHALQPGDHPDQHLHRQPHRLGTGGGAGRTAADSLAGRGHPLSAPARGRRRNLLSASGSINSLWASSGWPWPPPSSPCLSRHAAHGRRGRLGTDLTLGLRLVLCLSVPAGVGLIVLAQPLAKLVFERGDFTSEDTLRAGRMVAAYAWGVWAYCASTVMVRGFYALGDAATPVRIGAAVVALNLALNLDLDLALGGGGLGRFHGAVGGRRSVRIGRGLLPPQGPVALAGDRPDRRADRGGHRPDGRGRRPPPSTRFRLPPGWSTPLLRVAAPVSLRRQRSTSSPIGSLAAGNCRCCSLPAGFAHRAEGVVHLRLFRSPLGRSSDNSRSTAAGPPRNRPRARSPAAFAPR